MDGHLLVVFPHPDDESFGAAGTMILAARAGTPVTYLCGTLGEMGRNLGRTPFATRESLPQIREQELREACRIMGVQDLRLMGLRDKTIEFEDPSEIADQIAAVLSEIRPDKVITFYPGYAIHPDHDALAAAVVLAVGRMPAAERPVLLCQALGPKEKVQTDLGEPDVIIPVASVSELKMAALRAHRTQTAGMLARLEERMDQDPEFREQVEQMRREERFWTYRWRDGAAAG